MRQDEDDLGLFVLPQRLGDTLLPLAGGTRGGRPAPFSRNCSGLPFTRT